jgi:predicted transcriptional regulator of viral defense system
MPSQRDLTIDLLRRRGVMRASDLAAAGVHPPALSRMAMDGTLIRVARGLYELADAEVSALHSMAEVAVRVPNAVICLVSALLIHGITLANPGRVWIAIRSKDRTPATTHVGLRVVRFGGKARSVGIETHVIDGVSVRVTSPARTIVDCFRFRRIVGLDVALEALRMGVRSGRARPAEIAELAMTLRIWTVIRPYLEAVAADDE